MVPDRPFSLGRRWMHERDIATSGGPQEIALLLPDDRAVLGVEAGTVQQIDGIGVRLALVGPGPLKE